MPTVTLANFILTGHLGLENNAPTKPSSVISDKALLATSPDSSSIDRQNAQGCNAKVVRRLERQRDRLVRRLGPTEAVDRARKRLMLEKVKKLEAAEIKNCAKKEMTRVRRAADCVKDFPLLHLPKDVNEDDKNNEDELVIITDDRPQSADYCDFAGKIVIQSRPSAIRQALSEHSKDALLAKEPGRHSFHVDASFSYSDRTGGIAVAQKAYRRNWTSEWVAKGYRLGKCLDETDAEAWAIWQALDLVRKRANVDKLRETSFDPCSLAVVYSDSMFALQGLKLSGPISGLVKQQIIKQTQELRQLDVKVELHWSPGHRGVPGNELADRVAKKALQYTQN